MSRKGMALAKVATGIIILALLLILIIYLAKVWLKTSSLVENSECSSSIIAHATLIKALKDDITPEIYCPTKYYTITSSDEEKVKYYLAESMKTCWGTWGRGELDLFFKEGTYCHICSVFDFKQGDMKLENFNNYLMTHKLQEGPFKGVKYLEYLGSAYRGDIGEVENTEVGKKLSDNIIYTNTSYATMFIYAKGVEDLKTFYNNFNPTQLGGSTGTVIGGGVFGAAVGAVAGVVLCATGVGCAVVAAAVVGGVAGGAAAASVSEDIGWAAVTVIKPYNAEELEGLKCEFSPAKQDRQKERLG